MALPVAQIMVQVQEGVSDVVVAEAEEKADEAVEAVDEAEDMVATSATCLFSEDHRSVPRNVEISASPPKADSGSGHQKSECYKTQFKSQS